MSNLVGNPEDWFSRDANELLPIMDLSLFAHMKDESKKKISFHSLDLSKYYAHDLTLVLFVYL